MLILLLFRRLSSKGQEMKTTYFKLFFIISTFIIKALFIQQSFAQEIDTFFTTPEERAYLDFLRQEFLLNNQANDFNIEEVVPVVPVIEEEAEDAPIISSYTLGGIFTRQDGTRTVWLNNANIDESNLPENMSLRSSEDATLLTIQLESGRFDLRAGQTLDAVNEQVLESWQLPTPEQNIERPEGDLDTTESDIQPDSPLLESASANLAVLDAEEAEQVDPLPMLEVDTISISAEEIRSIISNEDPAALTEFMQTLQNFEEVQIDDNLQ